MPMSNAQARVRQRRQQSDLRFFAGLVRAFGGAMLFAVPTLMTMEIWQFGFTMSELRLALMIALTVPLLAGFSYFGGFQPTIDWREDIIDAFVAYAVGFVTAAALLPLFGVVDAQMSAAEIVGKVALQASICSIGAMLARSQFGEHPPEQDEPDFGGHMFIALIGALALSLNIAPTEEVLLLAHMMGSRQLVALALLTLALMHALMYAAEFRGQLRRGEASFWSLFVRSTVVAYAIALLVSLFMLWSFGRLGGDPPVVVLGYAVVLGFPAGIGAAAARLIL